MQVEETLSTLSYAMRAKNIHNRPTVQVDGQGHLKRPCAESSIISRAYRSTEWLYLCT